MLAHVQEGGKTGKPHSHGTSWAIYGNAKNVTEMTEYRRANPESEEHAVLEPVSQYALRPGDTRGYGPGVIHSTAHPREGLGDPHHRHRPRQAAALPLPQAGPRAGEGVTPSRVIPARRDAAIRIHGMSPSGSTDRRTRRFAAPRNDGGEQPNRLQLLPFSAPSAL